MSPAADIKLHVHVIVLGTRNEVKNDSQHNREHPETVDSLTL